MIRVADAVAAMAALMVAPLTAVTRGGRVLVLAPHADDETLGCGGLIAAAALAGHPPSVLIVTDGAGSHPASRRYPPARRRALREREARDAVGMLGLPRANLGFLRLPDTQAPMAGPAFEAAVDAIAALAAAIEATALLAPWEHDPHCDHLAAHRMAKAAAARCGMQHWSYPVWGWTLPPETALEGAFPTGVRIDIGPHLDAKRRAIAAHASQYSGLIDDDASGFQLPPELLAVFKRPYETFLRRG